MIKKMLLGAAALFAITACSDDNNILNPNDNVARGETTYASFAVNLASSRAATDNGVAEEQAIEQVHLYIFSGGMLEKHVTPELGPNNKTAAVQITTGEKTVYAVTTPAVSADGATGLTSNSVAINVTEEHSRLSDFEKQLFDALASDVAQSGKFVMVGRENTVVLKKDKEYAEENPVAITLDRVSAKALVKYDPAAVVVRPTIAASFDNARYTLSQQARQMYMTLADGLYTPAGDVSMAVNGTYPGYLPMPAAPVLKDAVTVFEGATFDKFEYTAESVNAQPVSGNTTFALIALDITPDAVYSGAVKDETTGKVNLTPGTPNADGTFYVAAKHDSASAAYVFAADSQYNLLYFTSEEAANEYITAKGLPTAALTDWTVLEYKEGKSYYRVNLITDTKAENLSAKYRVLRNHYYRIEVKEIKALGANLPEGVVPENPDEPIEAEGWLVAEITVNPWTICDNPTILQ